MPSRVEVDAEAMRAFAAALLVDAGASESNARIVSAHLVESSQRGVHSHGVLRIPQYLAEIETGAVDPIAVPTIAYDAGARVIVAGNGAFGQVGGACVAETAIRRGTTLGLAVVSAHHISHTGRIGAYAETVAEAGLLALAFATATGFEGRRVAPFGGLDARFSTNPMAYAYPSDIGVVVADFSTSTAPEGVIRSLRNRGLTAPPETLLDAQGQPTTDPGVLYRDPPGTILTLGGQRHGHKGSALNLLVEIAASILAGQEYDATDSPTNTLTLIAIRVDDDFAHRAGRLGRFVRSSRPAQNTRPVMLPGDPERAALADSDRVLVDGPIWQELLRRGKEAGVAVPLARLAGVD